MVVGGNFSIVSIPEPDPMEQALNDVLRLVNRINGKLVSIIINNYGRETNEIEGPCIQDAQEVVDNKQGAKLVIIPHTRKMFQKGDRLAALKNIGRRVNNVLEGEVA